MARTSGNGTGRRIEWPTLAVAAACYGGFAGLTLGASAIGLWLAVPALAVIIALHSSLQHEVLHGHPFRNPLLNEALVFLPLGLAIPYRRFRDTHLDHHFDPNLTDPYEDPESNYLDPAAWARAPRPLKALLGFNNTLAGRMLVGPALGLAVFYAKDVLAALAGDAKVIRAYALHLAGALPVLAWLWAAWPSAWWAYGAACYGALSLLKIRTFLEHRAEERAAHRSVVIEDRGPLALLFLNNNYHAVHHAHPKLPWYQLPGFYEQRRESFLRRNGGYRYRSYAQVFRSHLLRAKDPVAHPLLARGRFPRGERAARRPAAWQATSSARPAERAASPDAALAPAE